MSIYLVERRANILSLFEPTGLGLEIGPSYDPFLPKSAGYNVETVDYADATALRAKYPEHVDNIEDVDYVSDGRSILDLIGQKQRYDFIYASHVIEHVPDFIHFISDCESLLKDDGTLMFVVPDKRFCFDALRTISTVGDMLQAFHEKRERHPPGLIYDFIASYANRNGAGIWSETDLADVTLSNSPSSAHRLFKSSITSKDYLDIHAWRFTPSFFRYAIKNLRDAGYLLSGVDALKQNTHGNPYKFEFYVKLKKSAPTDTTPDIDLWKDIARDG